MLLHAACGLDARKVAGQVYGQQLVSSEEHEITVMLLPEAIVNALAHLDPASLDEVAVRWHHATQNASVLHRFLVRPVKRFLGSAQSGIMPHHKALSEIHDLASVALHSHRRLFLMQCP